MQRYLVFKHRNVGVRKPNGSYIPLAFGEKGFSDIIGCSPTGQFIAIEVKQPGKKPSPEQLEFIENVVKKRGIALVAHSLDDVMEMLP